MGRHHPDGGRPLSEGLPIGVRRARPEDRTAVLNFASQTWNGWDYIPDAWQPWLEATDGVLLVAEAGADVPGPPEGTPIEAGQPIALARVTMLSDVDAWLEGMRVDPAVRGRDVGTSFQAAELAWATAQGATFVRYAAGEDNIGSHRLGARHDFALLSRWLRLAPIDRGDDDPEAEPRPAIEPAAADGLRVPPDSGEAVVEDLLAMIDADPTFALGDRLYEAR
ncbi:MAG TPA: GNAT family N-acetyltransferase, partial [Candidatus Limnocylindrales bacterium]|nr:GNAT family N-acetyltransferase [Candidatus Limnocylindrales bacterium]